ncbi:tRNA lysidine(34) synthetase TilS [Spirosoma sp. RP8]|uniref:tRNA(Ile)-lysidine synthase n=1 Tax=Spirosoma liriopis TaxID=2937440 RepID=A0ABT0HQA0_9BACT|nr:tRNA lysidine(34) synthetase TilS [Spirosoma liriopis]MCK8494349.1 tRNA lysidine(34) synthetase TilS [Spirosoma liriopis]
MVEREFLGFINDNQLFDPTDRVLLAVSGGLDSMVMTELFHQTKRLFAIAHVNFGLRGAESDADAHFVQNKAEQYGVPFHQIRFDTAAIAEERGVSIQMAARNLRYDWFRELARQHDYDCIATAHHKNDMLETLLLNLTRGTGLAGLHGIAAKQQRSEREIIIRPLLFATRDQLADYATEKAVTYREDSSNANDKYARNRIRHHVVPVLTELNAGLWQTLPRTVERLRAAETLVQSELNRSWNALVEPVGEQLFLPTVKLKNQNELAFRLAEWLKPFGFAIAQVDAMIDALNQSVGQVFVSTTHRIMHDRLADGTPGLLLEKRIAVLPYTITLRDWPDTPVDVAGQFALTIAIFQKTDGFKVPATAAIACLDARYLTLPLTIRPWQQGDRFRPLGLNGHKLVSDLLNDLKLTRSERESTAVLLSGDQIVWVIGRRIDHRYRITSETRDIVKISLAADLK